MTKTVESINCMLSIKTKFLLIVKPMYFPNPFGLTLINYYEFLELSSDCHSLLNYEILQKLF